MKHRSIYRPYSKGSIRAPLQARSTGHYIVDAGWRDHAMRKEFVQLYWGVAGAVRFQHHDCEWLLRSDEVCFYLPGDAHRIEAVENGSEYYWMTFDGPHMDFIVSAFGVAREARPAGNCPVELFLKLERELRNLSGDGEYRAGAVCYEILSLSRFAPAANENQTAEKFKALVEEHYRDCAAGVEELAGKLGIHRTTLNRVARQHFGMPPAEYLVSFRVQEAMKLLRDTDYSIKEIAETTGFSDQNYFAKVIFRRFGKTPSQLRKHG